MKSTFALQALPFPSLRRPLRRMPSASPSGGAGGYCTADHPRKRGLGSMNNFVRSYRPREAGLEGGQRAKLVQPSQASFGISGRGGAGAAWCKVVGIPVLLHGERLRLIAEPRATSQVPPRATGFGRERPLRSTRLGRLPAPCKPGLCARGHGSGQLRFFGVSMVLIPQDLHPLWPVACTQIRLKSLPGLENHRASRA